MTLYMLSSARRVDIHVSAWLAPFILRFVRVSFIMIIAM